MARGRLVVDGMDGAPRRLCPAAVDLVQAQQRRGATVRRATLGLALGLAAALAIAVPAAAGAFAAFVHAGGGAPRFAAAPAVRLRPAGRGEATAMRVSPYYSNVDRERLARQRKETRLAKRTGPKTPESTPLNYDMLPAVEDIYNRQYTGNATADPPGGRKRYQWTVLFKYDPRDDRQKALQKKILEYIYFMKYRMSCTNIAAQTRKSPLDGRTFTTLEYPMKEYGEVPRGMEFKPTYDRAIMVEFELMGPPKSVDYIQKKMYADNAILRFMVLGHTRTFKHIGEDNELHL